MGSGDGVHDGRRGRYDIGRDQGGAVPPAQLRALPCVPRLPALAHALWGAAGAPPIPHAAASVWGACTHIYHTHIRFM